MRIHVPLLSVLSTVVLITAFLFGGDVTLYDLRVHAESTDTAVAISIHPTWLCWMDTHDLFRGGCYGNVMICDETLPTDVHKLRIVAHEARHLDQWEALGAWVWAAKYVLPLEPWFTDWSDPSVELAQMWDPPEEWENQWGFLRISIER